jgi:hypothetical protein
MRLHAALAVVSMFASLACLRGDGAAVEDDPALDLRREVEAELATMNPALAGWVRRQPWLKHSLGRGHLQLVITINAGGSAVARGLMSMREATFLTDVAEKLDWYRDGLSDKEAAALAAVYRLGLPTASIHNRGASFAGSVREDLATTLSERQFSFVGTDPATRTVVVALGGASSKERIEALALAREALARLEGLLGEHHGQTLFIHITSQIAHAGEASGELISVQPGALNLRTVAHEVTHTMFVGWKPFWFREGIAHFLGAYLADSLWDEYADAHAVLAAVGADRRLQPSVFPGTSEDSSLDRARGLILLTDVYEIIGMEGMRSALKKLRVMTASDQQILEALYDAAADDSQHRELASLYCEAFASQETGPKAASAEKYCEERF